MLPFRQYQDEDPPAQVDEGIDPDIIEPPIQRPGIYNPDTQSALQPGESATTAFGTDVEIGPDRSIFMRGRPRPAVAPMQVTAPQGQAPTAAPFVRPPMPGGGAGINFDAISAGVKDLPLEQAQAAANAAIKFQAARGYQADIQAGMSPQEAMTKWGPMLLTDKPQSMGGAFRQAIAPQRPTTFSPAGALGPGSPAMVQTGRGTVHFPPPTPVAGGEGQVVEKGGQQFLQVPRKDGTFAYQPLRAPPKPGALSQIENDDLKYAERELDKETKRQEDDNEGRRAFSIPFSEQTDRQRDLSAAYRDRQIKINGYQRTIDNYHDRVKKALQGEQGGATPVIRPPSQPTAPTQAMPLPANPTKENLVVGQVYQTHRGMLRWDGNRFQSVRE